MKNCFKKVALIALVLSIVFNTMGTVSANDLITVFVNGTQINFDVNPITESYRTLVPMRFIFEALGATVTWDGDAKAATATKGDDKINVSSMI